MNQNTEPEKEKRPAPDQDLTNAKTSIVSMLGSLAVVGLVVAFMFGFKMFLKNQTYQGNNGFFTDTTELSKDDSDGILDTEPNFESSYIMIMDVPEKGFYADTFPGKKTKKSVSLKNGQILRASARGRYGNETYYHLDNGYYVAANGKNVMLLSSYEELEGYVAITYISSSGVRLRSWADFKDDSNIVKSVFVGDKVNIIGEVQTVTGVSAYVTDEGLYMTTDIQYFNDYTKSIKNGAAEESATETTSAENDPKKPMQKKGSEATTITE